MSVTWVTKYGVRRVRVELPTLEDALYAAEGLTPDTRQQIHIAAALMRGPEAEAMAEAERIPRGGGSRPKSGRGVVRGRGASAPVVAEGRPPRRFQREAPR